MKTQINWYIIDAEGNVNSEKHEQLKKDSLGETWHELSQQSKINKANVDIALKRRIITLNSIHFHSFKSLLAIMNLKYVVRIDIRFICGGSDE